MYLFHHYRGKLCWNETDVSIWLTGWHNRRAQAHLHAESVFQGADWRRTCAVATWWKLPEFHQPGRERRPQDGGAHRGEDSLLSRRSCLPGVIFFFKLGLVISTSVSQFWGSGFWFACSTSAHIGILLLLHLSPVTFFKINKLLKIQRKWIYLNAKYKGTQPNFENHWMTIYALVSSPGCTLSFFPKVIRDRFQFIRDPNEANTVFNARVHGDDERTDHWACSSEETVMWARHLLATWCCDNSCAPKWITYISPFKIPNIMTKWIFFKRHVFWSRFIYLLFFIIIIIIIMS